MPCHAYVFHSFIKTAVDRGRHMGLQVDTPFVVVGFSRSSTIDWYVNKIYGPDLGWKTEIFLTVVFLVTWDVYAIDD